MYLTNTELLKYWKGMVVSSPQFEFNITFNDDSRPNYVGRSQLSEVKLILFQVGKTLQQITPALQELLNRQKYIVIT